MFIKIAVNICCIWYLQELRCIALQLGAVKPGDRWVGGVGRSVTWRSRPTRPVSMFTVSREPSDHRLPRGVRQSADLSYGPMDSRLGSGI